MSAVNNTWSTEPLGSAVLEMKGGASLSADDFTDFGFPVLHKGSIQPGGRLDFGRDGKIHTSEEFVRANPNAIVDDRFVVATLRNLVRTGETLGFVAPVPEGRKFLLAQGAYGLRLDPERLDSRYLSHLSNAWVFHSEVLRRMVGTTQVHIRNGDFLAVPVPLPPLAEQRRIARILDNADLLRAKRRGTIAQLDTLTQSIFLDMFGDPATNPKGWPERPFDEAMRDETSRSEKLQQSEFLATGRFPVVDQGQADIAGYCDDPRYLCQSVVPAVVFGDHTRAVKLVREPFVIGADGAKVLVPQPGIDAELLYWLLRLVSIPDLGYSRHMREVKRLRFLAPPMDLQHEFSRRTAMIDKVRSTLRVSMGDTEALFASLQHRAFRREL